MRHHSEGGGVPVGEPLVESAVSASASRARRARRGRRRRGRGRHGRRAVIASTVQVAVRVELLGDLDDEVAVVVLESCSRGRGGVGLLRGRSASPSRCRTSQSRSDAARLLAEEAGVCLLALLLLALRVPRPSPRARRRCPQRRAMTEFGDVGMVVIDPIGNHIAGKDSNSETDIRDAICAAKRPRRRTHRDGLRRSSPLREGLYKRRARRDPRLERVGTGSTSCHRRGERRRRPAGSRTSSASRATVSRPARPGRVLPGSKVCC